MDDSPIQTALCVIGHPIGGNPTQFVAARALASLGLDWQFLSFDVDPSKIANAIAGIDSLGFCGAMIADPYQTEVASILAARQDSPLDPLGPDSWHDFIFRNERNELVLSNLCAEALREIIELHSKPTGSELFECLLVGEIPQLKNWVIPFLPSLPENRTTIVGSKLMPWNAAGESGEPPPESQDEAAAPEEATEPLPTEEASPAPTLIIWASSLKPSKKVASKISPSAPNADFLKEIIAGLHPDSLCIDLSGTATSWFTSARDPETPPIVSITKVEWDVRRLALAIQRWTSREPNLDAMREAIEEYLEV